jgi:hypothetical protein
MVAEVHMGLLGQMFRLYTVAAPTEGAGAEDRRPVQLRLDDVRRRLAMAAEHPTEPPAEDTAKLLHLAHDFERILTVRNVEGQRMEEVGHEDGAVELYEANVADMYSGPLPYSRLLEIYERRGETREVQRIARACLAHALVDLPADVRALCLSIVARAEQHK